MRLDGRTNVMYGNEGVKMYEASKAIDPDTQCLACGKTAKTCECPDGIARRKMLAEMLSPSLGKQALADALNNVRK